jgi:hypothetical protein
MSEFHLGRLAVGDQPALVQHDDAVGERADHVHLVLDQQDGLVAAFLDGSDDGQHGRHLVDAHAGGRLVEHEDVGLERQQDRDLELALVAVRRVAATASARSDSDTAARCSRARSASSRWVEVRLNRSSALPLLTCTASRTFSSAVRLGKRLVSWKARPSPSRVRRGAA